MRRAARAVVIFIGLTLATSEALGQQVETGTGSTNQAHVVVYRTNHDAGKWTKPSVYCDGKEVALMYRGRYFTITLSPGKHTITSSGERRTVSLDVRPAATYYLEVSTKVRDVSGFGVEEIEAEKALKELARLHPADASHVSMPEIVSVSAIAGK
jgi:hypothetical protein